MDMKRLAIVMAAVWLAVPGALRAAGDGKGKLPRFEGDGEVMEFIDQKKGGLLDIGGLVLVMPPGVDTGGMVVGFRTTRDRPPSSSVHRDFTRHGTTMELDVRLKAKRGPIRVGFNLSREPRRAGKKFVLAVESSGPCEGKARRYELPHGGCSHWQIVDTEYDEKLKAMVGEVMSTGGYRLQFGWMPR